MSGHVEHIPDILTDSEFDFDYVSFKGRISNTRALMGVPLLQKAGLRARSFWTARAGPSPTARTRSFRPSPIRR